MALTTVRPQGMGFNTGRRNLVINGAMRLSQRGTSAVTVSDGSNEGYTTVDRYYLNFNASIGGAIAVSQSTDTPSGFANSIKLDCTTANTSISGTQMIDLQHRFEAQDLQQLGFGSSDAQSITVSWYMKAVSFSDNISVTLNTRDGTKEFFAKSFTPTTSWARYTMTVPGSTSATIDNNNGEGLRLSWVVAGSSSGTHAASSDSTAFSTTRADYRNDIGNLTASTDNELYITGVQLELGENASDFEHRSFGDELRRCQRYFELFGHGVGRAVSTSDAEILSPFKVDKRAAPTIALSDTSSCIAEFLRGVSNITALVNTFLVTTASTGNRVTSSDTSMTNGNLVGFLKEDAMSADAEL